MYNIQWTLYDILSTAYNILCSIYSVHCIVYKVQYTKSSVQYAVYNVHHIVYNVQVFLLPLARCAGPSASQWQPAITNIMRNIIVLSIINLNSAQLSHKLILAGSGLCKLLPSWNYTLQVYTIEMQTLWNIDTTCKSLRDGKRLTWTRYHNCISCLFYYWIFFLFFTFYIVTLCCNIQKKIYTQYNLYTLKSSTKNISYFFNRPGVAGAVL